MPLISVIVPVYKVEKYIHRCIDSILNQTYQDFELILVDDGSPDKCGVICDEYAARNKRITVIHKKNEGVAVARNTGLDWVYDNTDSQWLAFIDSDDWVHPEYLSSLLNAAISLNTHIAMCGECFPYAENEVVFHSPHTPNTLIPDDLYCTNYLAAVSPGCKLYHRSIFQDIRYPIDKIHEDIYISYKLLFSCQYIAYIDSPMYCYFQSQNSITRSPWIPARLDAIPAHEEALEFFIQNHHKRSALLQHERYIKSLANNIWGLQQSRYYEEYAEVASLLVGKLRKAIVRFFLKGHHLSITDNHFVYDAAFPRFMVFYWKWKQIKSRFSGN